MPRRALPGEEAEAVRVDCTALKARWALSACREFAKDSSLLTSLFAIPMTCNLMCIVGLDRAVAKNY